MRTAAILSALVLSTSLVAACGGDNGGDANDKSNAGKSGGSYCDRLEDAKADFEALDSDTPDFEKFDEAIDTFHGLADDPPSEVAAEWKTVDDAFVNLEKELEANGLTMQNLAEISAGQVPDGFTAAELQALGPKLQKVFGDIGAEDVEAAGEKIEKHAKDECDIELSEN